MPVNDSHSFYIPTPHYIAVRVGEELYGIEKKIIGKNASPADVRNISRIMKSGPIAREDNEHYMLKFFPDGLVTFLVKSNPYSNLPENCSLYMEWVNAFVCTLLFCSNKSSDGRLIATTSLVTPNDLFLHEESEACGVRISDPQYQYRIHPEWVLQPSIFHFAFRRYLGDSVKINIDDVERSTSIFNKIVQEKRKIQYLYNFFKINNFYIMFNYSETILYSGVFLEWLLKVWLKEEYPNKQFKKKLYLREIVEQLNASSIVKGDVALRNLLSSVKIIYQLRNSIAHKTVLFPYPYYDDKSQEKIKDIDIEPSEDFFTEQVSFLKDSVIEFLEKPDKKYNEHFSMEEKVAQACLDIIRYFFIKKFIPEMKKELLNPSEKSGRYIHFSR